MEDKVGYFICKRYDPTGKDRAAICIGPFMELVRAQKLMKDAGIEDIFKVPSCLGLDDKKKFIASKFVDAFRPDISVSTP